MFELMSLKSELMLICSTLTKALLVEILTAVEKVSQNPETKEKISSFITSLYLEAVDKIFKILEDAAVSPVLKDPPELGRIFKGGAMEETSTEQTVILVYNKNAAVDSKCILLALQDPAANFTGENKATGKTRTLVDLPDHSYAQCSSQPLSTSTSEGGGVSQFARTHLACSLDVRPYRCDSCGQGFTQADNLRGHSERQLCSICGNKYRLLKNNITRNLAQGLPAHELPAAGSIVTCQDCGKEFLNHSQFRVHQQSHTGEKPYSCDVSGKNYYLKDLLRDHNYTHTSK